MTALAFNARSRLARIVHRLRKLGIRRLFLRLIAMNAQVRMHRARLEAELYRNRYRLRTKNDDDAPIIH